MQLDQCPRCKKEWVQATETEETYDCQSCHLRYYAPWDDHCHSLEWRLILSEQSNRDLLEWVFNNHICTHTMHGTETILPWLPFDITEEQLKLYLVMS